MEVYYLKTGSLRKVIVGANIQLSADRGRKLGEGREGLFPCKSSLLRPVNGMKEDCPVNALVSKFMIL